MLDGTQIKALRKKLGETQTMFGDRWGRKKSAVYQWEEGSSHPPGKLMIELENLYQTQFDKGRVKEDNAVYGRGDGTGPPVVITAEQPAGKSARQIADEVYKTLTPEARAKIDGEYAAMVMKEKAKQDYMTEGGGYDD